MGHESQIEPWSPIRLTFCFAGFGTDRLRCQRVMKTAGTENPNRWVLTPGNRALGAEGQNRSCSSKWAAKEENFQPRDRCFFLTFPFIEQTRTYRLFLHMFPTNYCSFAYSALACFRMGTSG